MHSMSSLNKKLQVVHVDNFLIFYNRVILVSKQFVYFKTNDLFEDMLVFFVGDIGSRIV